MSYFKTDFGLGCDPHLALLYDHLNYQEKRFMERKECMEVWNQLANHTIDDLLYGSPPRNPEEWLMGGFMPHILLPYSLSLSLSLSLSPKRSEIYESNDHSMK